MSRINVYYCKTCQKEIVTRDFDEGTTPMMLRCVATAGCAGTMMSAFYRVDQSLKAEFEWYKPASLKGFDRATKEHIRMGGLIIRKIGE
jgi:hypothetical protein